jgi:hypothetical protein
MMLAHSCSAKVARQQLPPTVTHDRPAARWPRRGGGGSAPGVPTVRCCGPTASSSAAQALLQAVAASRRPDASAADSKRAILARVAELERSFSPASPRDVLPLVDGTWALVYSTKASEDLQRDDDWLQRATGSLYQVFFRFAPFLAGSQDTGRGTAVSNLQVRCNTATTAQLAFHLASGLEPDLGAARAAGVFRVLGATGGMGDVGDVMGSARQTMVSLRA